MDRLIDVKQAAEMLNTPVSTLHYWRRTKYGPKSAVIGRRLMYHEAEVVGWVQEQFEKAAV